MSNKILLPPILGMFLERTSDLIAILSAIRTSGFEAWIPVEDIKAKKIFILNKNILFENSHRKVP
jgi:hypothetical protein